MISQREVEEIAERAAHKAIAGFFVQLGIDATDPITMQRDFAHLRGLRESSELIRKHTLKIIVGSLITATIGALAAAFGHKLL